MTPPPVSGYELTPDDLDALASIVSIAGAFGAGRPARAPVLDAMARLYAFTAGDWQVAHVDDGEDRYILHPAPAISNRRIQAQLDGLLESLVEVPTVFGRPFPALFSLWMYMEWRARLKGDVGSWQQFRNVHHFRLVPLAGPAAWVDALNRGLDEPVGAPWNQTSGTAEEVRARVLDVFDPVKTWADAGAVDSYLWRFRVAQRADLDGLKGVLDFGGDAVLFLLHLLAGLSSSGIPANRQTAATILGAATSLPDHPVDTMASQLVYASMMALADPRGKYLRRGTQIGNHLAQLAAAMVGIDLGGALTQALDGHGRIAHADSAYPMQDPYVPAVGFTQRYARALTAIGFAWRSV